MISGAEKSTADCTRRSPASAPLDAGSIPAISTYPMWAQAPSRERRGLCHARPHARPHAWPHGRAPGMWGPHPYRWVVHASTFALHDTDQSRTAPHRADGPPGRAPLRPADPRARLRRLPPGGHRLRQQPRRPEDVPLRPRRAARGPPRGRRPARLHPERRRVRLRHRLDHPRRPVGLLRGAAAAAERQQPQPVLQLVRVRRHQTRPGRGRLGRADGRPAARRRLRRPVPRLRHRAVRRRRDDRRDDDRLPGEVRRGRDRRRTALRLRAGRRDGVRVHVRRGHPDSRAVGRPGAGRAAGTPGPGRRSPCSRARPTTR